MVLYKRRFRVCCCFIYSYYLCLGTAYAPIIRRNTLCIFNIFYLVNIMFSTIIHTLQARDVEAVEYFCFRFLLLIKLVASEFASASSFFLQNASARFHKNLIASTSLPHDLWKKLPLPASQNIKCIRVCFRFQLLSSKCFRFPKNLTASAFHILGSNTF